MPREDSIKVENGDDKFGLIGIYLFPNETTECDCCNAPTRIVIRYWDPKFPKGINIEDGRLVLKTPRGKMCVFCFAKLHRQIVHIEERMKRNG